METNKPKIDWLNHSLEFIVVIFGILLAFQLNQYSAEKKTKKLIDDHLKNIYEETQFNKRSLERSIAHTQDNVARLDTLLDLISNKKDLEKANELSMLLLNIGGAYLKRNAYQTLIESGDVRHLKDFSEKRKIIYLYEYYAWVEQFDELSYTLYQNEFYPYLRDHFDLKNASLQNPEVYQSQRFINILSVYHRTSQNRLTKYQECIDQIDTYWSDSK